MKIRFYFAQMDGEEQPRNEYIVRYNMHEGIVTTLNPEAAATFDLSNPTRRLAANTFQAIMQHISSENPNPVQFEIFEDAGDLPHHSV